MDLILEIISLVILTNIIAYIALKYTTRSRELPTLYQRVSATFAKAFTENLPLWLIRILYDMIGWSEQAINGFLIGKKRRKWCRKIKNGENWTGYLIAEDAQNLEVGDDANVVILYAHGGGFTCGNALLSLVVFVRWIKSWKSSHNVKVHILSLEYALSPENCFPAARENMIDCYLWLVNQRKISPSKIVFVVSALYILHNQVKLSVATPSALLLISPCFSRSTDYPSFQTNKQNDNLSAEFFHYCLKQYLGDSGQSPNSPSISPITEIQFNGLPKIWACVGSYEIMLDSVVRFIEKVRSQEVKAELIVAPRNMHDYAIIWSINRDNAAELAMKSMAKFLFIMAWKKSLWTFLACFIIVSSSLTKYAEANEEYLYNDGNYRIRCSGMFDKESIPNGVAPLILLKYNVDSLQDAATIIYEWSDRDKIGAISPGDDSRTYICDGTAIEKKYCSSEDLGRIIVNSNQTNYEIIRQTFDPAGEDSSSPIKYEVKKSGYYCAAALPVPPTQLGEFTVTVEWHNPYGELPASDYPKLPFYGSLSLTYLVIGLLWMTLTAILLCLVAVLNAGRNSISFFMLLIVCMGYGVVNDELTQYDEDYDLEINNLRTMDNIGYDNVKYRNAGGGDGENSETDRLANDESTIFDIGDVDDESYTDGNTPRNSTSNVKKDEDDNKNVVTGDTDKQT
ncbi:6428_t:CDS:10 [Entrophospora sp. SA101]|nr:6428_t:CDS:10 [Entrophospora sp. SA101]